MGAAGCSSNQTGTTSSSATTAGTSNGSSSGGTGGCQPSSDSWPLGCNALPAVDAGVVSAVVQGATQFAINLFSTAAADAGAANVCLSPASISLAFSMAYRGAEGDTATQIAQVLNYPDSAADLLPVMRALACQLVADAAAPDGGLALANAFFGQTGALFGADFVAAMNDQFSAPIQYVDFQNDLDGARAAINAWVASHTDCQIPELLTDLPQGSLWALVNALFFHGTWANPFATSSTFPSMFHTSAQSQVQAPMMNQTSMFPYAETDTYQVLELPFTAAQVAVDILLPTQMDGLAALRQALSPTMLQGVFGSLQGTSVAVQVPKLKLDTSRDLIPELKALGLTIPFDSTMADFTPLLPATYVLVVRHESTLTFEEGGLSASAATVIVGGTTGGTTGPPPQPKSFVADHPFLLLVRDAPTGAVLFIAQVNDPTQM
jgi:serpin B